MTDTKASIGPDLPVYHCPKVAVPPIIDGRPDDDAWTLAPVAALSITETGKAPSRATTASMCWDNDNLYILFECEDPEIWATYTEHDDPLYDQDVVEAFLDPDCDPNTYIELEFSPKNVTFDAKFDIPAGLTLGNKDAFLWTCEGMRTAVTVDGDLDDPSTHLGWTVEVAVPFASLGRETPRPGEEWRGNLYRIDYRPEPAEFQAWSPTIARNYHTTSRFGTIVFTAE